MFAPVGLNTQEVEKMLAAVDLDATFKRAFWKRLSFFALVLPDNDIFPVRTVYSGRTHNIGLNYMTSREPIWFAGPDIVAAKLLGHRVPRILKAIRLTPQRRRQSGLTTTNLAGMVDIDPTSHDFFTRVIEQKTLHKSTNKPLSHFLKILANSGSYGLFVEVNPEHSAKPENVKIFSGEIYREKPFTTIEKQGRWYFSPLASLITAGGRLLLAMLERCVTDEGGSYLFSDTDSLCIVASKRGGLVQCPGGPYTTKDGRAAVKALTWQQVDAIARRFEKLNPYNPDLVRHILKVEDINYVDGDPTKPRRQLFGYAVSAKRYNLYIETSSGISIVKASGHGLGYLFPPKDGFSDAADAPAWVVEAWDWLLRKELGLPCRKPAWLDLPAMMRIALTSPNILRQHRPEWLAPFNFFFFPVLSDLDGYPAGCNRSNSRFITRFSASRGSWKKLECVNLLDGQRYRMTTQPDGKQDKVVPETFSTLLRQYLRRPESKSLAPDGNECQADTRGLLKRASVVAGRIIPVGKETDKHWDQGEDLSLLDFHILNYAENENMVLADDAFRDRVRQYGIRKLMRATGLHQHTIEAIRSGKTVRRATLQRVQAVLKNLPTTTRS